MRIAIVLSVGLACVGCHAPSLQREALTLTKGCSDLFVAASNAEQTQALYLAGPSGTVIRRELEQDKIVAADPRVTLPTAGWSVRFINGHNLLDSICTDYLEPGRESRIDTDATALQGRIEADIVPAAGGNAAAATLRLFDLVFEDGTTLPRFDISSVTVGWFPG